MNKEVTMARKFLMVVCGARDGIFAGVIVLLLLVSHAQAAPFLPNFDLATFSPGAAIDNTYFSLTDSKRRVFRGEKEEDGVVASERFEFTALGPGPTILSVQTTTRRDRAFKNDVLMEDTFDYFAQDTAGNVWYFGEDVTNYRYDNAGNLIGTDSASAWRAGVNGALPGFIMPADLTLGFNYLQEFAAADKALDQGTTIAIGKLISIGIGDYSNVLQVLETSELIPDLREFKYYAPGQGLILVEEGLDADLLNPTGRIELTNAAPLPATLSLLMIGLFGLLRSRVIRSV
jgi:hypothetical protein